MKQEFNWKEQAWKYPFTTNPASRCAECGEFLTVDPKMHPCGPEGFLEHERKWRELNAMTPELEPRKKSTYNLRGMPHHEGTIFSYDNWLMPSYQDIVTQMEEQTGCTFEFLGCFMDVCSFRTDARIYGKTYSVTA